MVSCDNYDMWMHVLCAEITKEDASDEICEWYRLDCTTHGQLAVLPQPREIKQ